jgi:dTMP kinase
MSACSRRGTASVRGGQGVTTPWVRSIRMDRPLRIALIGVDGSGKTTLARALADELTAVGHPATYFENAGGRATLNKLAERLGRRDAVELLGAGGLLAIELSVRWLAITYALLWSRLTGRIAVMDRYVYCQLAAVRSRRQRGERVVRALYRFFPSPDLVCFLAVDPQVAQRRVEQRGIDTEELDYLVATDSSYRSLPEWTRFLVVDANAGRSDVRAEVWKLVQKALGKQLQEV